MFAHWQLPATILVTLAIKCTLVKLYQKFKPNRRLTLNHFETSKFLSTSFFIFLPSISHDSGYKYCILSKARIFMRLSLQNLAILYQKYCHVTKKQCTCIGNDSTCLRSQQCKYHNQWEIEFRIRYQCSRDFFFFWLNLALKRQIWQ